MKSSLLITKKEEKIRQKLNKGCRKIEGKTA